DVREVLDHAVAHGAQRDPLARAVARMRQQHLVAAGIDLRSAPVDQGPVAGVVGDVQPAALAGDAEGDHLEALAIDRGEDAAGGDARDAVLAAAAAEQEGDGGSHTQRIFTPAGPSETAGPW